MVPREEVLEAVDRPAGLQVAAVPPAEVRITARLAAARAVGSAARPVVVLLAAVQEAVDREAAVRAAAMAVTAIAMEATAGPATEMETDMAMVTAPRAAEIYPAIR